MSSHHMSWCEEVKVASALNYTPTLEQNVDDIDFDFLNMFEWFFILICISEFNRMLMVEVGPIQSFFFIVDL